MAAVTLAMAVAGPRAGLASRVKRLWPAYALAAPWIAIRAFHALPTDLAGGGAFARLVERLGHADSILALLASRLFQPWAWIALVAALLVIPAAVIVRERFVLGRDGDPARVLHRRLFRNALRRRVARVGVMAAPHIAARRAGLVRGAAGPRGRAQRIAWNTVSRVIGLTPLASRTVTVTR